MNHLYNLYFYIFRYHDVVDDMDKLWVSTALRTGGLPANAPSKSGRSRGVWFNMTTISVQ